MLWAQYRKDITVPWDSLLTVENINDYPQKLYSFIKRMISFNDYMDEMLGISYILLPSALLNHCAYLQVYGVAGSGKSTLGYVAAKCRDMPILSSSDTFAAIRNEISEKVFRNPNLLLVWDDLDPKVFTEKPDLYRLLKYGYCRETSKISIAGRNGDVIKFESFCPKIISSIHSLFDESQYPELSRRLLVIEMKKLPNSIGFISPFSINWSGIDKLWSSYWNEDRVKSFLEIKTAISDLNLSVSPDKLIVLIDLLAVLVLGGFCSLSEVPIYLESILNRQKSIKEVSSQQATKELIAYLDEEKDKQDRFAQREGKIIKVYRVNPKHLKLYFEWLKEQGRISEKVSLSSVFSTMRTLGWKLEKDWELTK
ncbi:hypothetical protein [Gloeothece verrucosa]|uniref:Uncharacterized protein n=1 Tax=Gloeothece verrucosa (strain PCC 7822) TaxID=497965 RepID=E0UHR3_GLOV7|nr:hypothetical protein [Gloeothece verrucosa]ADN13320.1 hypothetical protein Cyan7822_1319 [Gloeothece verrucosa PCC 7822]